MRLRLTHARKAGRNACAGIALFAIVSGSLAQDTQPAQTPPSTAQLSTPAPNSPVNTIRFDIPHSWSPLAPYMPTHVPPSDLQNSPRLDTLIRDGKLYLSLKDAIALALENNLDLAIARYNIPIAAADVLRTKGGGSFRGVNTGVVQNTPGGGVGGFGGSGGGGAGGTSTGAGGAGAGASGLVQSTLGTGTLVQSFDPTITATTSVEHQTSPEANQQNFGVPVLKSNTILGDAGYQQAFATGTSITADFLNTRQTTNSRFTTLSPVLLSNVRFIIQQPLLAGFGTGPNLRFLRIARNNQKISDEAFKLQVVSTVTQIANIYWDLVAAYEDEQVKERSLTFAQQNTDSLRKQLDLQAVPALDVTKSESEAATREQDLTIARTTLQLQELLMKNALTKNLDNSVLEAMPVIPTDKIDGLLADAAAVLPQQDPIGQALTNRVELYESKLDLNNRAISQKAANNALLPTLNLVGEYIGSGLAGPLNPNYGLGVPPRIVPIDYFGALNNAFNFSNPDYQVGIQLAIPIRNRIAKSDAYRSELEFRQAELREQELRKQIRIEVRSAEYTLEQSRARVASARKSRDLASKTFDITKREQELGAGSNFQTLTAQRDLSVSESALVAAVTAFEKAVVEVDRVTGNTLEHNSISVTDARSGTLPAAAR